MEFTHIANPVRVTAAQITGIWEAPTGILVDLSDGRKMVEIAQEMLARYEPSKGDYLVRQEDGYEYLNPKDVFERKYRLIGTEMSSDHPAKSAFRSRANEDELRASALNYASRHYDDGSESVVKAAEAYYQFLKGGV